MEGVALLVVLVLQAACATGATGRGLLAAPAARSSASGMEREAVYDVDVIEPGRVATCPVPLTREDLQRAISRLVRSMQLEAGPREEARRLLELGLEEEWLAEVYRDRVLTLAPLGAEVSLSPEAEVALRERYLTWCGKRGGGDCLGLLDDGPWLRTDDRRILALALALGPVVDETREAVARELNPRAVVALVVWTVGLYLALWVVPEPVTKGLAATLTVILVGWLGVDTVWGLMDGWARMATRAHEASSFEELREAGEEFARVLGREAARGLILGVGAVAGGALGQVASRVRALPGFVQAGVQWEAQAGGAGVLGRARAEEAARALVEAVESVHTVAVSAEGGLTLVMLKKGAGGGTPGRGGSTVIRHRGGNQQVLLGNGQRWHLPRGKWLGDIPAKDSVGDQLQEAVTQAAREWGPDKLSFGERDAIAKATKRGKYWLARLLEREARGRFVHRRVQDQFEGLLEWRPKGVDVIDPATGHKYEILSGTESNLTLHGRRMAGELFRMLTF
ncbi:hypothetical protein CYFUS_001476 [Cystobacter fuscus]|uniref:Uncharacterized protein n=2 Tax=Cystobacter fuscus TaxID=43 RepID=A0A250IXV4_9BACT|nr:hypothetical protein CYFUS_001476 [Cystobacter fuscus]